MIGKQVKVIPSNALNEIHLSALAGSEGEVMSVTDNGMWVKFMHEFQDHNEWFIPKQSIQMVSSDGK